MKPHPKEIARIDSVWFIETRGFTKAWHELRLSIDELTGMQDIVAIDPTLHPVIAGTGGLRKMRLAAGSSGKGKRGGARVCYAYLPRFSVVVLVMVFAKNEKADLTPDDKKTVKALLARLEDEFTKRSRSEEFN